MAKQLRLPSINSCIVAGRLTRDLELKFTQSGTAVVNVPIAFDRNYRDGEGNWQKEANFIDAVLWGARAESAVQNLSKGSAVMVEGSIKTRTYTTKENETRKVVEINAFKVQPLEWKDGGTSASPKSAEAEQKKEEKATMTDEDIPF